MAEYIRRPEFVKPVEEKEVIDDSTERFIIRVNDFKLRMGFLYSVIALRVFPFLLFIVPVNVVLAHANDFIMARYPLGINLNSTPLLLMWIFVMVGFLAVTIFAPKAATVVEFVLGFAYLYFSLRHQLYLKPLFCIVSIGMILFLLVKLVFLVFKIIRIRKFSNDADNIERDESGRIVRAAGEDVYFTNESDDEPVVRVSDEEVYFTNVEGDEREAPISDDEVVFIRDDKSESDAPVADNEVYFTDEEVEEREAPVSDDRVVFVSSDEDEIQAPVSDTEVFFVNNDDDEREAPPPDDDFFFG